MALQDNPGRIAYEYALKCYDVTLAAHVRLAERANKLIVVHALLFAALSFGLTNLGWLVGHRPANAGWLFWVLFCFGGAAGVVAGLLLVFSFCAALRCQRVEKLHVPSTRWISVDAGKPYFLEWADDKLLASLACNVRKSIQKNLGDEPHVERWAGWLNRTLLIGFAFTAVFLAVTTVHRVALSVGDSGHALTEENDMSGDEKQSENQEKEPQRTEQDVVEEPEMVIGKREDPHIEANEKPKEKRAHGADGE